MEKLIKKLSEAYGPSGREEEVRGLIKAEIQGHADEVLTDALGNLIAIKRGSGRKIMLAAHMDEVGIIITHIDKDGFLRFTNVGGVSPYTLLGTRFRFPGGVLGTVGVEKPEDVKKNLSFSKMYVDIGAIGQEEAEGQVKIGSIGTFEGSLTKVGGRYSGKALDDRIGCAVLVKAMQEVRSHNELYFVFTVQEELGLRGARTAAYRLEPDYGLAVDVTRVGDTPESKTMAVSLGKGPTVKVKDSSILCHPQVKEMMIATAEKNSIPYQLEVLEKGGTDAGAIHLSREGIPAGVMSIPCRYIHTPAEMVDVGDVTQGVEFLKHLLGETWR